MTDTLVLPPIPRSPMFNSSGTMIKEWQDFFLNLFLRVGGLEATSLTDVERQIALGAYDVKPNFPNVIFEVEKNQELRESKRSFAKDIQTLEKQQELKNADRSFAKEMYDLEKTIALNLYGI